MKNRREQLNFKMMLQKVCFVCLIVCVGFQTGVAEAQTPTSFHYVKKIPMPLKEQQYLYQKVKERNLDYEEVLATILHESSFRPNVVESGNYGYFQINKINHASLAKTLKTKNKPLDPYINIDWGTYMLSSLYDKYSNQGLKGTSLKEAVLSAFNKGEGGYKKTGKATSYIEKHNEYLAYVKENY